MDELSRQTWFNLTEARRLKMRMGEVTITEINLLAIRQLIELSKLKVEIVPTRADESKTGADFEIWLDFKGKRFFGYAVQAKVVGVREDKYTYAHLGHKAGSPKVFQYDLLEAHAKDVNAHAVHVFFNGWALPSTGAPALPPGPDAELFGCAALMTSVVREIRAVKKRGGASVVASDYLDRAVPWSELFRTSQPRSRPSSLPIGSRSRAGAVSPTGGNGDDGNDVLNGPRLDPRPPGPEPTVPIELGARGIGALERRARELGGELHETRRATKLPDYVTESRGLPREDLGTESYLPTFAIVIRIG
jgi:hypothetical protein